jgi:hypothetical protein
MIVPNMPGGFGDLAGTGARGGPAMAMGADILARTTNGAINLRSCRDTVPRLE